MVASSASSPRPRRLSRAEYDRMGALGFFDGERVELILGTLVTMSPIGPRHASVVDRLTELLVPRLIGTATVRIQQPFATGHESEPEPDLAVVPRENYQTAHPDRAMLIVEVAESSLEYDRDTKGALYAASGVPEYWVVDVVGQSIEVYREPADGRYSKHVRAPAGVTITIASHPQIVIAVRDLFV